jgi:hypothetical protein
MDRSFRVQRSLLKSFNGMRSATILLWIFHLISNAIYLPQTRTAGPSLYSCALSLLICAWVMGDARKNQNKTCYDFDSFLFFAWPIVAPIYLFQTRRWRGVIPIFCFVAIWLIGSLVSEWIFTSR